MSKKEKKYALIGAALLLLYLLFKKHGPTENVTSGIQYGPPLQGTQSTAPAPPLTNTFTANDLIPVPGSSSIQTIGIDPVTGALVPIAGGGYGFNGQPGVMPAGGIA